MTKKTPILKKKPSPVTNTTPWPELAALVISSLSGKCRIPAVGVVYEMTWKREENGSCTTSVRVAELTDIKSSKRLRVTKLGDGF